jgi:hypothetical protein
MTNSIDCFLGFPGNIFQEVELTRKHSTENWGFSIQYEYPMRITNIIENSPAHQAGLKNGVLLAAIDGLNVFTFAKETTDAFIGMMENLQTKIVVGDIQRLIDERKSTLTDTNNYENMSVQHNHFQSYVTNQPRIYNEVPVSSDSAKFNQLNHTSIYNGVPVNVTVIPHQETYASFNSGIPEHSIEISSVQGEVRQIETSYAESNNVIRQSTVQHPQMYLHQPVLSNFEMADNLNQPEIIKNHINTESVPPNEETVCLICKKRHETIACPILISATQKKSLLKCLRICFHCCKHKYDINMPCNLNAELKTALINEEIKPADDIGFAENQVECSTTVIKMKVEHSITKHISKKNKKNKKRKCENIFKNHKNNVNFEHHKIEIHKQTKQHCKLPGKRSAMSSIKENKNLENGVSTVDISSSKFPRSNELKIKVGVFYEKIWNINNGIMDLEKHWKDESTINKKAKFINLSLKIFFVHAKLYYEQNLFEKYIYIMFKVIQRFWKWHLRPPDKNCCLLFIIVY